MNEHTERAYQIVKAFNERQLTERDRIALAQVYATIGLAEVFAPDAPNVRCEGCGIRFTPKRPDNTYHSRECGNNAQHRRRYQRRKEGGQAYQAAKE